MYTYTLCMGTLQVLNKHDKIKMDHGEKITTIFILIFIIKYIFVEKFYAVVFICVQNCCPKKPSPVRSTCFA